MEGKGRTAVRKSGFLIELRGCGCGLLFVADRYLGRRHMEVDVCGSVCDLFAADGLQTNKQNIQLITKKIFQYFADHSYQ